MRDDQLLGIHHITAIAGDPQSTLDFYAGVLGLRLVKKTVNFDDPFTYHFYFGDGEGRPGSIITFFPWTAEAGRGRQGSGQITSFAFCIPADSGKYWNHRLTGLGLEVVSANRFGDTVLIVPDPDGFNVELVETREGTGTGWNGNGVPAEAAILGLHSVTVTHRDKSPTAAFMVDELGFSAGLNEGARHRFSLGEATPGAIVDLLADSSVLPGTMGVGIIHHVAFRTGNDAEQSEIRETLVRNGRRVSPVMDRQYFRSIYFNEPGGVLYEVATDPPGFMIDEDQSNLGKELKLPAWYEPHRRSIEQVLPVVVLPDEHVTAAVRR